MARSKSLQETVPSLWRILRAFWPRIRKQRSVAASAMLALFAATALRLLEPWPLKFIFDYVLIPVGRPEGVPGGLDPMTVLALSAAAVIVITVLRAMAEYWSRVGFALVGNRVLTEARNDLYQHLQKLSLSFHHKARGGDLTVRVIGDINMLKDMASTALLPLVASLLILVSMVGIMFWLEWRLTLLALAALPLIWLSTVRLGRRIREAARKQRSREGELAATAAESLTAIKVVQALSLEGAFGESFSNGALKSQKENVKTARLAASLERWVDVLAAGATALVLWYGARLVLNNTLTPGDLLVFLAYLKRSFNPLQDFAKYTGRLAKAAAAGERVLDVLGRIPEVRDLPGAVPAPSFRGEVQFKTVSFGYESGRPVLDKVDFIAPAGMQVALVGPSGIGKSTLVNLLLRLYDPGQGQVLIDGQDIRSYTLASLRGQISVVLQDSLLFAASVRDNIAYGAPTVTPEEVEKAACLANADDFIRLLPQGYDTLLGERGATLSHGQRQRIAIARASIRKTPILILDEPTTGLDEENEREVIDALQRLARGRTTFLVTHDLQLAARSDLILYLEKGHVLESGSHEELMRTGGRYAALYRLQTPFDPQANPEEIHALGR